jgi:hypothetical protein
MKAAQGIFAGSLCIALVSASLAQVPARPKLTPLDEALDLYQQFSGNTVLRSPNLPSLTEFDKPIPSSDTNGMRIVLENELLNKGIELVPSGQAIIMAVETGWKNSPTANYIATIERRRAQALVSTSNLATPSDEKSAEELLRPGTVDFGGADLRQFLELYATLLNRNVLRPAQLASSTFKLHTQTPFTKGEMIYLLEVALALNGVASVDDGQSFVQVVPLKQISTLSLRAPMRDSSEPLLKVEQISPKYSANEVVAYYAELTGYVPTPAKNWGPIGVVFRAQTPLTKTEILYALESGLSIVELDDKTVSLSHLAQVKPFNPGKGHRKL